MSPKVSVLKKRGNFFSQKVSGNGSRLILENDHTSPLFADEWRDRGWNPPKPGSRNGNQWSFDVSFSQESFKTTLILTILVSMDRAQSGELGTLYFCRCRMYISYMKIYFI